MFEAEPGTSHEKGAELRDLSPALSRGTFTCASSNLKFPRPPRGGGGGGGGAVLLAL